MQLHFMACPGQDALNYMTSSMGKTIEGQDGCGMLKEDAYAEKVDYRRSKH